MKRCCFIFLPILLLFILFAAVPVSSVEKYHGKNRFWTVVDEAGKTYLSLPHMNGFAGKLIFPSTQKKLPKIGTFTTSNKNCRNDDAHVLNFDFIVKPNYYYLQGHVGVGEVEIATVKYGVVTAFMSEKCPGSTAYVGSFIPISFEDKEAITTPKCFGSHDVPFQKLVGDSTKNAMDFKVDGVFDCPAFFVLGKDTTITDAAPPDVNWVPSNASYPGEPEHWWKTSNNATLPVGATFDADQNPVFDVLKMVKTAPYFIRYGSNQPIPTFQFELRDSCTHSSYEIQLNEDLGDDCKITVTLAPGGFKLKTKQQETPLIKAKIFFSLVFDSEAEAMYIKTLEPAVSITRWPSCKVGMDPSAADQMKIRASVVNVAASCANLKFSLLKDDVNAGIHMLVNTTKIAELLAPPTVPPQSSDPAAHDSRQNQTTSDAAAASASFEWWWVVVPVLILLVIAGAIAACVTVCIRRRRAKQKKLMEENARPKSLVGKPKIEKAEPPIEKELSPRSKKRKQEYEDKHFYDHREPSIIQGFYFPEPPPPKVKPAEEKSCPDPTLDVQTTQMATVDDKVALVSKQSNPPSKPPATPLLKHRSMYETGGFKTNDPYDYHAGESPEFEASSTLAVLEKLDLKTYQNFWSCIEGQCSPPRYSAVYGSEKDNAPGRNVWFIVRDLVADDDSSNAPFRSLANRMLEPLKKDFAPGKDVTETTVDGQKKYFLMRIFVLSYHPFTLELHCRGQCPPFVFSLFDCEKCQEYPKEFQKNAWLNSSSTCNDDWDSFVCRVKRTSMNSHQFLSYNGASKPNTSDDVNHILIVRGSKKPNKLRPCVKGCDISESRNHPNGITIETEQQRSPTLTTQNTQQQSSE